MGFVSVGSQFSLFVISIDTKFKPLRGGVCLITLSSDQVVPFDVFL
jgi:hypothetical protein